jgi:hypothetical protein
MEKLLFSVFWTLLTGAVTWLGWVMISTVVHRLRGQHTASAKNPPSGSLDKDAEERRQVDWAEAGVRIALGCLIATPVAFLMSMGVVSVVSADPGAAIWSLLVGAALMSGYAFLRYKGALGHRQDILWYHEARAMVDRAVAPLVPRGYVVFRDFSYDEIRIDHLLVGPKGVFAVQTHVRPTHPKEGQSSTSTVTYDGRALFFPQGEDHIMVGHAERQAEQVSEWITKHMGVGVAARAILTIPGWQVKRTSSQGISVINPAQMEALFQYIQPWPLSEDLLLQIVRLLENHHGNFSPIPIETVTGEGLPR